MTTLELYTSDEELKSYGRKTITSGDVKTSKIKVDFDSEWDGFAKIALFRNTEESNVYEMILVDNECLIPHEVLKKSGFIEISLRGIKNNIEVKTSSVLKVEIKKGELVGYVEPGDPATDIYKQLLSAYADANNKIEKGLNNISTGTPLVASSISEMTDTSRIYVNTADGKWYYYNGSNWEVGGIYQAETNPEVEDIRTSYDGFMYDTAGNSVRSQISEINNILDKKVASHSNNLIDSEDANGKLFSQVFSDRHTYFNIGRYLKAENNVNYVGRIFFTDNTRVEIGTWQALNKNNTNLLSGGLNSSSKSLVSGAENISKIMFYWGTSEYTQAISDYGNKTIKRVYFGKYESNIEYDDYYVNQKTKIDDIENEIDELNTSGINTEESINNIDYNIDYINKAISKNIIAKSRNLIDSTSANGSLFETLFPNSDLVYFEVGKLLKVPNNVPLAGRIFFEDGTRVESGSWRCEDKEGNNILGGGTNASAKTLTENAEKINKVGFYIGTSERANYQGKTISNIYFGDYKSGDNLYDDYYVELDNDINYKIDKEEDYLINNSNYPFEDFIKMPLTDMSATNYKKIIDMFVDIKLYILTSNPLGYFIDLIKLENNSLSSKKLTIRLSQFVNKEINHIGLAETHAITNFSNELITLDIKNIETNSEVIGKMIIRTKDLTSDFMISNIPYEASVLSQKCFSNDFKLNSTSIINQGIEKVFNLPFENDTFSFGVLTDTHYTNAKDIENCVKAGVEVVDKTPVDALICLGDNVPGNLTKARTLSQMRYITGIMAQTRKDFYCVKGNHDVNDYQFDPKTMSEEEWLTTEKDIIRNMISLSHSKNKINYCSTNKTFYYVDYEDKKVRCIFLNTSERVGNQTIWGVTTEEQKTWVKNVALNFMDKSDRTEWKVIVFCHIIPVVGEFTHDYGCARPGFHDMLVAFKNGSSSLTSGYECNFQNQGAMKLVGVFGGHVHDDCYGKVDGINYIISTCITPQKKWDTSPIRSHYGLRDISNNIFMIDFSNNKIYRRKIGSGTDETWNM